MPKFKDNLMIYVGIDPGKSGGLAVIDGREICVNPMPGTEQDIWNSIRETSVESLAVASFAAIEKVHSFPGQGVVSTGTFMRGYGFLRGCLTAAGIPFEEVPPQEWMRGLGIPQRKPNTKKKRVKIKRGKQVGEWKEVKYGGESQPDYKNRLLQFAQQLYPSVEGITLSTCDALLIATYCKRLHEGSLRG